MKNFLMGVFLTGMLVFSQNTVSAAEQSDTTTQTPQKNSTEKIEIVPSEASYTLAIIPTLDMSGMEEKERTVATSLLHIYVYI